VPRLPFFSLPLAVLLVATWAVDARADVSSWFYAGGGATQLKGETLPTVRPGTLQLELGMGSPPDGVLIVGGLFKMMTFFSEGTDLALTTRFASGGFVRGGFGIALDAGGYQRWWGRSSTGFLGAVVLGAPLGLQLTAMTEQGTENVHSYGGTIGIDFLRLTVYRTTLRDFWPNPFLPAHVAAR